MRGILIKTLGMFIVLTAGMSALAQNVVNRDSMSVRDLIISQQGPNFLNNFSGNFVGVGARAEGMGNAFLAVSDDISALSWNPAGLIGFEKPVLGFSVNKLAPRGSFVDGGLINAPRNSVFESEQSGSLSNLSMLSFLSPVRIRGHQFVFSASYARLAEDYSTVFSEYTGFQWQRKWAFNFATRQLYVADSNNFQFDMTTTGTQHAKPHAVAFGFGTRVSETHSIGLSVNVLTGRQYNKSEYFVNADSDNPLYKYKGYNVLLNDQTVAMTERLTILDTFSFSGVNFALGAKGTFGRFSYGVVVKTGFDLKWKGGSTIGDTVSYGGAAVAGRSTTIFVDEQLMKITIPWTFAAGGAFRPSEDLVLAADFEYRPYGNRDFYRRDSLQIRSGQDNLEYFTADTTLGWFDCISLRGGAEYLMKTSKPYAPTVPLRCGLGYTQVPSPNYEVSAGHQLMTDAMLLSSEFPTTSTAQWNISAGTGIYWPQIHLDFAYTYSWLSRNQATVVFSQQINERLSFGELKSRNHNLTMTFTGYF